MLTATPLQDRSERDRAARFAGNVRVFRDRAAFHRGQAAQGIGMALGAAGMNAATAAHNARADHAHAFRITGGFRVIPQDRARAATALAYAAMLRRAARREGSAAKPEGRAYLDLARGVLADVGTIRRFGEDAMLMRRDAYRESYRSDPRP